MAEWEGRVIDGRYAVESMLGSGGMGVVLRARHKFTGGLVALKMLHADLRLDAQLEARFLAEARASNAIGHPAIVSVIDAGRTPEGELYLVMELLSGQPMRPAVQLGLGQPAIKRIGLELLDALAAAHARGFVHRDLKPENVFLAEPNGTVKLLDFGIAKVLTAAQDAGNQPGTQAGVVLGTIAYMAPEQLRDAAGVDARADLWALGVMIYEMLSRRLPYRGTSVEEMFVMLANEEPDPIRAWIPTIAPEIDRFFTRALARDPAARFRSALEMSAALAQLPLALPPSPAPVSRPSAAVSATVATGYASPSTPLPIAATAPTPLPVAAYAPTPLPVAAYQPAPAANRSRVLGIVFGLAAIGVITTAVVLARGRGDKPKVAQAPALAAVGSAETPPPPPQIVDAPPPPPPMIDAAIAMTPPPPSSHERPAPPPRVIAPTPPPAVTTPSVATPPPPPSAQPQQPYPDAPKPPATDPCPASCAFAATKCGLATTAACMNGCRRSSALTACIAGVHDDCNELAHCLLDKTCGNPTATGGGTCRATLACQVANCNVNNISCGCACAMNMSSAHSSALYAADACATACMGNARCIAITCQGQFNRCNGQ